MLARIIAALAIACAFVASTHAGSWEDGVAAYESGDFTKALELWRPLAETGDARGQNNLGVLYEKGLGVPQDYSAAVRWYRLAAERGNELARKNLIDLSARQVPDDISSGALTLYGNARWVTIASRQDLNEAISLAKQYSSQKSRVVQAKNGWFAVVLGPYSASDISAFRSSYSGPELPRDAFLAQGLGYVRTLWPTAPANTPTVEQGVPNPPPSGADRSVAEVCSWALNAARLDWDTRTFTPDYVGEAKRRHLTVNDCRAEMGLPSLVDPKTVSPASDPSSRAAGLPHRELCGIALNPSRLDWETKPLWAEYVAEAKRRKLGVGDCQVALGLRQPDPPQSAPPPNASQDGGTKRYQLNGGALVEFSTLQRSGKDGAFIFVEGAFKGGDEKSFRQAAANADFAVVGMNSPGGDLDAGLQIGEAIWVKEFATLVANGSNCESACAFAWLAGRPRYMERGARIGFHAPRRADDPLNLADSGASAVVGAYLAKLGLKSRAIQYVTEKKPTDMQYLTLEDAERLGIDVKEFKRK